MSKSGHDKSLKYWWTFTSSVRKTIQWYNPENQPTLEDCVNAAERSTEQAYISILNNGEAGSAEATAAHAEWMAARTQRATMDADEKCVDENPAYLSIAF